MKKNQHVQIVGKIVLAVLFSIGCAGLIYTAVTRQVEKAEEVTPKPSSTPVPVIENYDLDLLMAGDALLHGAVYKDAYTGSGYDFKPMYEEIKPILSNYDLIYYNQETILGGDERGFSGYPRFNSPQDFGRNMVELGFNIVTTANNHSLDQDEEGIINSTNFWKSQGIVMAGTYQSQEERDTIPVYEKNGITYAVLSFTYGTNGLEVPEGKDYLVNYYSDALVEKDIDQVRDKVDVLMVAMHWGDEYSHDVSDEQERIAHFLADKNVNIVIGCHPHVIEPIEWIDDTIVFYSLGNMISAQDVTDRLIGMLGAVHIHKTVIDGASTIEISQPKADLIYTYYDSTYHNFKLYPFSDLTDSILPNHEAIYAEYKEIITEKDSSIRIGGLE